MDQLQELKVDNLKGTKTLFTEHVSRTSPEFSKSLFPSTRYYGSKLRLIEWLNSSLEKLEYNSALDCFGGTGTVSLLFKYLDKDVTYNDALWSNQYVAKSILSEYSEVFDTNKIIDFFTNVKPQVGVISKNFEGYYFTNLENNWIDGAISKIFMETDPQFKSDLMYCLFQASLQKRPFNLFHRKNLYLRENCQRNTKFGNWRTWERNFTELTSRAAKDLSKAKNIRTGTVNVLPPTDASVLSPGYDLVYIDPPYLKKTSNDLNYQDRYHFLEGLARYHDWSQLIDYQKKTRCILGREEIINWNIKSLFRDRLFDLINTHRNSTVVLSYETNGYPNVKELEKHFKSTFKDVSIVTQKLSHSLRRGQKEEVLIIGS